MGLGNYGNIKEIEKVVKRAQMATRKAGQMRKNSKNIGKCENYGANVRFAEIEDGNPRNTAISTARMETADGEKRIEFWQSGSFNLRNDFAPIWMERETMRGAPNNCWSCIIATCFNGGAMCGFNRMYRYGG